MSSCSAVASAVYAYLDGAKLGVSARVIAAQLTLDRATVSLLQLQIPHNLHNVTSSFVSKFKKSRSSQQAEDGTSTTHPVSHSSTLYLYPYLEQIVSFWAISHEFVASIEVNRVLHGELQNHVVKREIVVSNRRIIEWTLHKHFWH